MNHHVAIFVAITQWITGQCEGLHSRKLNSANRYKIQKTAHRGICFARLRQITSLLCFVWFWLCPFTQGKKKQKQKQKKRKSRERVGREKGKKDHMYQLRYLLLACCSPLNWCDFFFLSFVTFYLYLICCLLK